LTKYADKNKKNNSRLPLDNDDNYSIIEAYKTTNNKERKMQLVDEYRSVEELRSWVSEQGIEYVSYYLYETEFYTFSEEEVQKELEKVLG
jgi:undecaprenyl pyrophosphate synthase